MNTIKFSYHGLILEVPYLGSHQCVAMNAQGDIFMFDHEPTISERNASWIPMHGQSYFVSSAPEVCIRLIGAHLMRWSMNWRPKPHKMPARSTACLCN